MSSTSVFACPISRTSGVAGSRGHVDDVPRPQRSWSQPASRRSAMMQSVGARAFNPFNTDMRGRQSMEDFNRVFEDDPFNPDDAWGASRTNNVRPFFNFNKHAGQWTAEDAAHESPHHESDFWFFNTTGESQASKGKAKYYYHEYNHHTHHAKQRGRTSAWGNSQRDMSPSYQQRLGGPDLEMARRAFQSALEAAGSVAGANTEADMERAEERIRYEIDRTVQYCAFDIVTFARALDCDPSSARTAKRSIVKRFHPDKAAHMVGGDMVVDDARKRLDGMLRHSILSAMSNMPKL